ncbi:MAG: DUF7507 domain-containing protein, partial [Methanotrichaceae archaeon]
GPFGDIGNDEWLNLSEVWTYTGTHTVTEMDVCDSINNTVTANATDVCGHTLEDEKMSYCVPTAYTSALNVTKTSDHDEGSGKPRPKPGTKITYTINVTNKEGDVNLTDVNATDNLIGHLTGPSGDDNGDGWLNLSETWIYRGTYTVTEKDVCGSINNTVTANATDPTGNPTEDVNASWCVPTAFTSDLNVTKTADYGPCPDGKAARSGETITYTINVSNEGNVSLTDVNVTDPKLDLDREPFSTRLEPGTYVERTFEYTVGLDDLGQNITNTVVANAIDPCGNDVNDTGSWCVPTEYISAINVNYDRLSLGDQLAQSIGKGPTAKNRLSVVKRQSAS